MEFKKLNKGFTLVELLVVIAIIGALSSVVLSSIKSIRSRANDAAHIADVRTLKAALEMYHNDNHTYFQYSAPDTASFAKRLTDLAPTYMTAIPTVFRDNSDQYVWSGSDSYGLYIYTEAVHGYCKTGVNMNPDWWGNSPECNF